MHRDELIEWVEKSSGSFDQWLNLMRFGRMALEEQPLLALELIVREAERKRTGSPPNWCVADIVVLILERLKWDFVLVPHSKGGVSPGGHCFVDGQCHCGQRTTDDPKRCDLPRV